MSIEQDYVIVDVALRQKYDIENRKSLCAVTRTVQLARDETLKQFSVIPTDLSVAGTTVYAGDLLWKLNGLGYALVDAGIVTITGNRNGPSNSKMARFTFGRNVPNPDSDGLQWFKELTDARYGITTVSSIVGDDGKSELVYAFSQKAEDGEHGTHVVENNIVSAYGLVVHKKNARPKKQAA